MSKDFSHTGVSSMAYLERPLDSEKQLEDIFWANPTSVRLWPGNGIVVDWIARQFVLASGIADLVGFTDTGALVVVELKAVPANKAAVLQVCRYAKDLDTIAMMRFEREIPVVKVLIASSIDAQTAIEAEAVRVQYNEFTPYVAVYNQIVVAKQLDDYKDQRIASAAQQSYGHPMWDTLPDVVRNGVQPRWVVAIPAPNHLTRADELALSLME